MQYAKSIFAGVVLMAILGRNQSRNARPARKPGRNSLTGGNRYLFANELIPIIERAKARIGLPYTNDAIIAVCKIESGDYKRPFTQFDTMAYRYEPHLSEASYGVMQVLESTARDRGLKGKPEQMYNPEIGIFFGVSQLKWTRDFLIGTIGKKNIRVGRRVANGLTKPPTVEEVLMAYNGGVGTFLLNKTGTTATRQYVAKYQTALDIANRGLA